MLSPPYRYYQPPVKPHVPSSQTKSSTKQNGMRSDWQQNHAGDANRWARRRSLVLLLLLILLDKVALNIVVPLMPFQLATLGAGPALLGLITSSFALMQLLGAPVFGWLSDKYGHSRMLALSFIGSSCNYLLLSWAPNLLFYILFYIPVGLVRHAPALAAAYISQSSLLHERTQFLSFLNMVTSIGFVMGPGLGGTLNEVDQTLPTFVCAVIFFCNFILCVAFLPDPSSPYDDRNSILSDSPSPSTQEPIGIRVIKADEEIPTREAERYPPQRFSIIEMVLEEERQHYRSAPPIVLLLSPSFFRTVNRRGILYLFSFVQLYITGIILHFRRFNLLFFLFNSFLSNLVYSIFMSAFPLIGKEQFELTPKTNGMLMSYIGGLVIFAHLAVHFLNTASDKRLIQLAMAVMGGALVALSFMTMVEMLLIFMVPMILCIGLLRTTFLSTITKRVPRAEVGTMIGMLKSVDSGARVLGPAIGGLVFAHQGPMGPGVVGGLILLGAAAATFLDTVEVATQQGYSYNKRDATSRL